MRAPSPVIRIFISSTFFDFHKERDILHEKVFPSIKYLCESNGVKFQVVDLRWGISEESAFEQKTLQICLREVERCQNTFTIPHFLILLGNRYGWQPLPTKIAESEFNLIKKALLTHQEDLLLLNSWYSLEKNDFPPSYRLKNRTGNFQIQKNWDPIEVSLRKVFRKTIRSLKISSEEKTKYYLSATAHEILKGILEPPYQKLSPLKTTHNHLFSSLNTSLDGKRLAPLPLNDPPVSEHVFCFYRQLADSTKNNSDAKSSTFMDLDENKLPDEEARTLLNELKNRIRKKLGNNMIVFPMSLNESPQSESDGSLEIFAEKAHQSLTKVVNKQIESFIQFTPLDYEKSLHQAFYLEKVETFKGRSKSIRKIQRKIEREPSGITVIHGTGGIGKSALMANIIGSLALKNNPVLYRFIGLSSSSSYVVTLFESLIHELSLFLGETPSFRNLTPQSLGNVLLELLEKASSKFKNTGPLVLALDALDQLSEEDQSFFREWIVSLKITNMHLCLSCLEGEPLQKLKNIVSTRSFVALPPLEVVTGRTILNEWLQNAGRTLQKKQFDLILRRFKREGTPLYLKLAFEQARKWSADRSDFDLPESVEGVIEFLFSTLSHEHGNFLVSRTLSYLVIARHGLSEDELIDLLSRDEDVMEEFFKRSPQGKSVSQLPFMIWARLQDDLSSYITERGADNISVIDFFHRIFRTAIRTSYLRAQKTRKKFHLHLAMYYIDQPDFFRNNHLERPNLRRLSELPFHLKHSGQYTKFYTLLTKSSYFSAKVKAGRIVELLNEFHDCYTLQKGKRSLSRRLSLPKVLAEFIIVSSQSLQIDLEEIHATLVYKGNTRFYEEFLIETLNILEKKFKKERSPHLSEMKIGILIRKANLIRRRGNLLEAQTVLGDALAVSKKFSDNHAERSLILYELGYIAYLRGNFIASIPYMDQSAEESRIAKNMIGYWISRCVAYHQRWLKTFFERRAFQTTSKEFEAILQEALPVFEREKDTKSTAKRWVTNIYAHRFKLAFRLQNQKMAEKSFTKLSNDPWLKEYQNSAKILDKLRGRLEILRGNFLVGAQILEIALQPLLKCMDEELLQKESLAEDFFDLGKAFRDGGNNVKAEYWWGWAKAHLADNPGSQVWIHLINQQSHQDITLPF